MPVPYRSKRGSRIRVGADPHLQFFRRAGRYGHDRGLVGHLAFDLRLCVGHDLGAVRRWCWNFEIDGVTVKGVASYCFKSSIDFLLTNGEVKCWWAGVYSPITHQEL